MAHDENQRRLGRGWRGSERVFTLRTRKSGRRVTRTDHRRARRLAVYALCAFGRGSCSFCDRIEAHE